MTSLVPLRPPYARFRWVKAEPVREHLRALVDQGYSREAISRASGVPASTVSALISQDRERMSYEAAQSLLEVTPDDLPALPPPREPKTPGMSFEERYSLFLRLDYERSAKEVAQALGVTVRTVRMYRRRRREEGRS